MQHPCHLYWHCRWEFWVLDIRCVIQFSSHRSHCSTSLVGVIASRRSSTLVRFLLLVARTRPKHSSGIDVIDELEHIGVGHQVVYEYLRAVNINFNATCLLYCTSKAPKTVNKTSWRPKQCLWEAKICLRKDAEHLWKTLFISQEKGTLPW